MLRRENKRGGKESVKEDRLGGRMRKEDRWSEEGVKESNQFSYEQERLA